MRSCRADAFTFATLILTAAAAQAAKPQAWTFAAQKDFAQGRFENVVVDSYGELTLGRTLTPLPTDPAAESVQAFAQTPDGTVYVATSPAATVYRIQDGKTSVVYKADKGFDDITAMAADAKGHLLIALSGATAKLVSVAPGDKAAATLFEQKDVAYIWAIAQAADGTLYLGTGPHGKVYKLPAQGEPAVVLETGQKNVTSLAFDHDRNLIAGTDAHGLVIRVDLATGKPFVLLDAGKVDVNALTADAVGNLYVATAKAEMSDQGGAGSDDSDNGPPEQPDTKSKPDAPEIQPVDPPQDNGGGGAMAPQGRGPDFAGIQVILGASQPDLPPDLKALLKKAAAAKSGAMGAAPKHKSNDLSTHPGKMPGKALHLDQSDEPADISTVYRISPDGVVATLVQQEGLNYSLLFTTGPDGDELLIGTGDEGKLYAYRVHDESTALIARVKEQQISNLFADKAGNIFLGTGNMAQVYQMGAALSPTGSFTSQVLDASHTADWGHAIVNASRPDGTSVTIATRSGNTQDVDANPAFWSDWSDAGDGSKITSPAARFLQFRVTLNGDSHSATPTVNALRLAYQTHNLPPQIKNVSLELAGLAPSSDDDSDAAAGPDDPSSTPPEKTAHISWDATDPNNDTLVFRLYYKQITVPPAPDGKDLWTPLARDLKDATYEWDTRPIPDGKYQVKVVASDSPDNPAPEALETARTSAPFILNHTPPVLSELQASVDGNKATVAGSAKDALSPVVDVRYQVDGQISGEDWQPAAASDKIFDSPQEAFTLVTRPLSAGPHRITVRATDSAGNSSYKAVTITVKP